MGACAGKARQEDREEEPGAEGGRDGAPVTRQPGRAARHRQGEGAGLELGGRARGVPGGGGGGEGAAGGDGEGGPGVSGARAEQQAAGGGPGAGGMAGAGAGEAGRRVSGPHRSLVKDGCLRAGEAGGHWPGPREEAGPMGEGAGLESVELLLADGGRPGRGEKEFSVEEGAGGTVGVGAGEAGRWVPGPHRGLVKDGCLRAGEAGGHWPGPREEAGPMGERGRGQEGDMASLMPSQLGHRLGVLSPAGEVGRLAGPNNTRGREEGGGEEVPRMAGPGDGLLPTFLPVGLLGPGVDSAASLDQWMRAAAVRQARDQLVWAWGGETERLLGRVEAGQGVTGVPPGQLITFWLGEPLPEPGWATRFVGPVWYPARLPHIHEGSQPACRLVVASGRGGEGPGDRVLLPPVLVGRRGVEPFTWQLASDPVTGYLAWWLHEEQAAVRLTRLEASRESGAGRWAEEEGESSEGGEGEW